VTCVIAYRAEDRLVFAADSRSIQETYLRTIDKVARRETADGEGFLIGFSGDTRILQELSVTWAPPATRELADRDAVVVMANSIDEFLHSDTLKDGSIREDGTMQGEALVGFRGRIWDVPCDLVVFAVDRPFAVIGTADIARGVMATRDDLEPRDRMTLALETTAAFYTGVGPPWTFTELAHARKRKPAKAPVRAS
jgi:hypothetical protein